MTKSEVEKPNAQGTKPMGETAAKPTPEEVDGLRELLQGSSSITVFSGAGMSTESGIPDFRGPNGVWQRVDPADFHIDRLLASDESRKRYWLRSSTMYAQIKQAQPNLGHHAVVQLEQLGRLHALITQNVDGLHQQAGNNDTKVLELHGNACYVACLSCQKKISREIYQPKVGEDGFAPPCEACAGIMKPATISFGQMLDPQVLETAVQASKNCDLFLVVGSSLQVHPAATLPFVALEQGVDLVILNAQTTPCDSFAKLVVHASSAQTLHQAVNALSAKAGHVLH